MGILSDIIDDDPQKFIVWFGISPTKIKLENRSGNCKFFYYKNKKVGDHWKSYPYFFIPFKSGEFD